jgi:amino-acid N-acetyltransferase
MELRQAAVGDVPEIHAIISRFADQGLMLPRARARLYETVRDFVVATDEGSIVGVGALRTLWETLGEICSLAVVESHRRRRIGTAIAEELLRQARGLGLKEVLALTYVPGFFATLGFAPADKHSLPHKVWAECVNCPKFPDCTEQAMVRRL